MVPTPSRWLSVPTHGGAGPGTERPGRPESAGGRGHLGTAATARRQGTACLHAVGSRAH